MAGLSHHAPSPNIVEVLLAILILASLVLEVVLHRVERWIATSHVHLQAVLRNLYRELMVLGLVSFVFVFYSALAKPSATAVASFEFAHVFIFALAVVHTAVVLASVAASLSLSRRWKRMEQMDIVKYLEMKQEFRLLRNRARLHAGLLWRKLQWWLPNPGKLFRYWSLHEVMAFHDIRFQFLYYRALPEDFNFSSYLRKVKAVTFIELVDAHWSLWLVLLAIVLCDITRRQFWSSGLFESAFAIGAAAFLILCAALLTHKIRNVYWTLTKHPATYYNNITKEAVLSESRASRDQASSRASRSGTRPSAGFRTTRSSTEGTRQSTSISSSAPRDSTSPAIPQTGQPPGPDDSGNVADDELTDRESPSPGPASLPVDAEITPRPSPPSEPTAVTDFSNVLAQPDTRAPMGATIIDMSEQAMPDGAVPPKLQLPANPAIVIHDGGRLTPSFPSKPRVLTDPILDPAQGQKRGHPAGMRSSFEGTRITNLMYNESRSSMDEIRGHGKHRSKVRSKGKRPPPPPVPSDEELVEIAERHSVAHPASNSTRTSREEGREERIPQPSAVDDHVDGSLGKLSSPSGNLAPMSFSSRPSSPQDSPTSPLSRTTRADADVHSTVAAFHRISMDDVAHRERFSIDEARGPRRGTSLDESRSRWSRLSADAAPDGLRKSLDIKTRLPIDELVGRDVPALVGASQHMEEITANEELMGASVLGSQGRGTMEQGDAGARSDQRKHFVNPSLIQHTEHAAKARRQTPGGKYPKIVTRMVPRLARVASPAEKLFWFGSHRFFLWCVEFVLFMSTVLLASVLSAVILVLRDEKKGEVNSMLLVALAMSITAQAYVLTRVSYMMKKYMFVLNNAGLVPEVLALQIIHNIHHRRRVRMEQYASANERSDSDLPDEETEAAKERRRKFSRFFSGEVQTLTVLGIVPRAETGPDGSPGTVLQRRPRRPPRRKRSQVRPRAASEPIPMFPSEVLPSNEHGISDG